MAAAEEINTDAAAEALFHQNRAAFSQWKQQEKEKEKRNRKRHPESLNVERNETSAVNLNVALVRSDCVITC